MFPPLAGDSLMRRRETAHIPPEDQDSRAAEAEASS